jgi:hypothetical protein
VSQINVSVKTACRLDFDLKVQGHHGSKIVLATALMLFIISTTKYLIKENICLNTELQIIHVIALGLTQFNKSALRL